MHHTFKKRRPLAVAVSATAAALFAVNASLRATTFPTTVFNATSAVAFDGSNFSSLALGVNSTTNPNSLVNLDGSLLVGYVTDTASGVNYNELYSVNLKTLSVSIVAFNDSNHQISDPSTIYTYSPSLNIVSSTGTIVGTQGMTAQATDGSGAVPTGKDVFTSNNGAAPVAIPLPTTVLEGNGAYSYTSSQTNTSEHQLIAGTGSNYYSQFNTNAVGTGGIVVGQIARYAGDNYTAYPGSPLGNDGFYYNPTTGVTTAIGLVGGQYDYNSSAQVSDPTLMNHSTIVTGTTGSAATGFTFLYDPNGGRAGYDGWLYTPSAGTVQIGLVGGPYTYTTGGYKYEFTQIYRTNTNGQIAGKSSYVSAAGDPLNSPTGDAWLYTPSATPGTASTFGASSAGTYAQIGLSAYPSGSTLGYTNLVGGSSFAINARYANITFLTNNGNVTGQSNRFDSSGNFQGQANWYYNGSTDVDISPNFINPSDTVHAAVAGGALASTNYITAMNNTGMAAGYATRISGTTSSSGSLGQDAYIYDSNNGKEYFADPVDEAKTSNYEFSYIGALSDSGYAVGYYNTYSGTAATTQTNTTLFVWSELGGLQSLNTFANTGSAANATKLQTYLSSFQFGSDGELYGPNTYGAGATSLVAYGLNVTWNNSLGTGDGKNWDTTSQNWTNGVIPLVYIDSAMVTFNDANNGDYAVTLNTVVTPNAVTFNNSSGNYTFSGTGGIGGGGGLTKLGTGSVTLSTSNTYTGATNVSGGSLILSAAGALPVGTNLNIGSGASVVANSLATKVGLTVGSLTVLGKLDLNNNGLVVRNSSIGAVTSLLQSGYNSGKWNGATGIVSTTASTKSSHLTALGVIINDTGANTGASTGRPLYSTLNGASTIDGDVLVKYSYYGDANLSGAVDASDYSLIDNGYLRHLSGWYNGDFNYDGIVNGSDYTLIDNAFNTQGATLAAITAGQFASTTSEIAFNPTASPVPEPSSMALLGLAAALRANRRRGRHCFQKNIEKSKSFARGSQFE